MKVMMPSALALPVFGVLYTTAALPAERVVENPPLLETKRSTPMPPAGVSPKGAIVNVDLNVMYARTKLWNPSTQRYDSVNLRAYQGSCRSGPPIAPSIEVLPGDTVRLRLSNRLPADPTCHGHGHDSIFNELKRMHRSNQWQSRH